MKFNISKEWIMSRAHLEDGRSVEAGCPINLHMTTESNMAFCKKRALAYIERGDMMGAYQSFTSDVRKFPDTNNDATDLMIQVHLVSLMARTATLENTRRWIEGFAS